MRLWLLILGSLTLASGFLMMFAVAFGLVMDIVSGGRIVVSIWHVLLPLIPTGAGLVMVLLAPRDTRPTNPGRRH